MRLIVGLGNPGEKYRGTRHNVGAETVGRLAGKAGVSLRKKWRFRSYVADIEIAGAGIKIAVPYTFMNLSGAAVGGMMRWLNCPPEELLVVSDDISLGVGRIRIRKGGSAGGHKGIESIIAAIGGGDFARLRIGIGGLEKNWVDHVLGRFTGEESRVIDGAMERALDAIEALATGSIDAAMNRYNAA